MMERRDVELVRLPDDAPSSPVNAEDVGRSAAAVFPTEMRKMKKVDEATIAAALGGKSTRFYSETELADNKAMHGERLEDGTFSGKTLTQAIIEQREAREAKFQDAWKQIKMGKNRPLEADELEFLEGLREQEAKKARTVRQSEAAALEAFRSMQGSEAKDVGTDLTAKELRPQPIIRKRAAAKSKIVRAVKPVTKRGTDVASDDLNQHSAISEEHASLGDKADQSSKGGLGGLLGGYGSDSSSDIS